MVVEQDTVKLKIIFKRFKGIKIIEADWIKGEDNEVNVISKNVTGTIFDRFASDLCGGKIHMN